MAHSYRISFEFFPPKTDKGRENLISAQKDLMSANPEFFSCTYGAGGSTRDNTYETVLAMQQVHPDAAPHLSSIGRSEEHTSELQSRGHLVCRLLLEKKKKEQNH